MFTAHPIGFIHSPFHETSAIPKGLGAKHDAEGVIELLREYEPGLDDIAGFSHLYVIWEFDRADGFDLIAHPPTDEKRPHGVFSTRSPRRPNPLGLTVVELIGRDGPCCVCAASTCSMELRFSTSNRISRAFRRKSCVAVGSPKPKPARAETGTLTPDP